MLISRGFWGRAAISNWENWVIGCPAHLRFYTCIVDDAKNISVPHTFGRERRDKEPPRLESGLSFLFSQSRLEPCAMTRAAHVVAASVVVSFPMCLSLFLSLSRIGCGTPARSNGLIKRINQCHPVWNADVCIKRNTKYFDQKRCDVITAKDGYSLIHEIEEEGRLRVGQGRIIVTAFTTVHNCKKKRKTYRKEIVKEWD